MRKTVDVIVVLSLERPRAPADLRAFDAVVACFLRGAEELEPDDQLDMLQNNIQGKYHGSIHEFLGSSQMTSSTCCEATFKLSIIEAFTDSLQVAASKAYFACIFLWPGKTVMEHHICMSGILLATATAKPSQARDKGAQTFVA